MNNQGFSKIWIVVIFVAFIGGGFLTYQNLLKENGKISCRTIYPANNSVITNTTPTLDWLDAKKAVAYKWLVELPDGGDVANGETAVSFATIPSEKLEHGKTYVWAVKSCTDSALNNCDIFSICTFIVGQ